MNCNKDIATWAPFIFDMLNKNLYLDIQSGEKYNYITVFT